MESAEASAASLSTAAATSIGVSLACSAAQQSLGMVADARCVGVFMLAEQVMMHFDAETPPSVQLLTQSYSIPATILDCIRYSRTRLCNFCKQGIWFWFCMVQF